MFEVQDLRFATLATVSRCGMVWFSEDVLSTEMIFDNHLLQMKKVPVEEVEEEIRRIKPQGKAEDALSPTMQVWYKQIPDHSLENMVCVFKLNYRGTAATEQSRIQRYQPEQSCNIPLELALVTLIAGHKSSLSSW